MKKQISLLLIALLLSSCGGHSGKSPSESVKTSATVLALSPVLLAGGSVIGGKNVAQKSAVATKAPQEWFSDEVSGERLRSLMTPTEKLIGKWHYMGSRGQHHFFSHEVLGRKIYRVLQAQYPVEEPFPLTSSKSKWRNMDIRRFGGEPFDEELLERFRSELPEVDQ